MTMSQLLHLLSMWVDNILQTGINVISRIVSVGNPTSGYYVPLVLAVWLIPVLFMIVGIFRRLLRKD